VIVAETFFAIAVDDMARAVQFFARAFRAEVTFTSRGWTSLRIAGVRVGLFVAPGAAGRTGLHFAVGDLEAACAEVVECGGRVLARAEEIAPGVVIAEIADPEGNVITLRA
jgi:predicted enzyme related to lactoylglutathione lyase